MKTIRICHHGQIRHTCHMATVLGRNATVRAELAAAGLGALKAIGGNNSAQHMTISWVDGPTGLAVRKACKSVPPELIRTHRQATSPLMVTMVRAHYKELAAERLDALWYRKLLETFQQEVFTEQDYLIAKVVEGEIRNNPSRGTRAGEVTQRLLAWRTLQTYPLISSESVATLEVLDLLLKERDLGEAKPFKEYREIARSIVQ